MSFDPTTPVGQVRALVADMDPNNEVFSDQVYLAYLNLNGQSIRFAAAQALEVMAANEILVQKRIRVLDLSTDGPAEAAALQNLAAQLRKQEEEGIGNPVGMFDWAEMILTPAGRRERVIDEWLREGS